jgi:hypothetical protein
MVIGEDPVELPGVMSATFQVKTCSSSFFYLLSSIVLVCRFPACSNSDILPKVEYRERVERDGVRTCPSRTSHIMALTVTSTVLKLTLLTLI